MVSPPRFSSSIVSKACTSADQANHNPCGRQRALCTGSLKGFTCMGLPPLGEDDHRIY